MTEQDDRPAEPVQRSEAELERILLGAREAKRTIIAVAALAIGSMIVMFLITLVIVALKFL